MRIVEVLRADADYAFAEVMKSIEGVTEAQAWAVLPNVGPDYLHTDGTIHAIVHHLAGMKKVHGSVCFRNAEYRWRDLYEDTVKIEPSWEPAVEFLMEAQRYWLDCWADLDDDRLDEIRPTNWKQDRSALEILRICTQHDSYHAGQIAVLRYGVDESSTPPPSVAEDILKYCRELPYW